MTPKPTAEQYQGTSFDVYYFDNPMMHEDWHAVEEMGLVYIGFIHNGPDYWDDYLAFTKVENKEIGDKWQENYLAYQ